VVGMAVEWMYEMGVCRAMTGPAAAAGVGAADVGDAAAGAWASKETRTWTLTSIAACDCSLHV
jgi:hypothetical protein